MATAHDILTRENWHSADIRDLAQSTVDAYGTPDQFQLEGDSCRLDPRRALALAMALHELGTNATRYGALSSRAGRVHLCWSSTAVAGDPRIELVWQEYGGPAVHEPAQRGFGSRLLERGLKHDLGGGVELAFAPEGVRCHLWMPQPKVEEGQLR